MGTSGPGNIVHIDNLYVKTFNVKDNENINLGDFVVIENVANKAVARSLIQGDIATNGGFVDFEVLNVVQAAESADNLDTTDALLRKGQIECITKGSDWVTIMEEFVLPDSQVGIQREDAEIPFGFRVNKTFTAKEILGVYKHKEFSTVAETSVISDNGIISTGRHI